MSYAECSVCLAGLEEPPGGDFEIQNRVVALRICGHVFHSHCLLCLPRNKCPTCLKPFHDSQFIRIFPSYGMPPPCDACPYKLAEIRIRGEEIDELTAELQRLTIGAQVPSVAPLEFGARYHMQREFSDARCMNCESKEHMSIDCRNPPILRFAEQTTFARWAPIFSFKSTAVLHEADAAGTVIKYYCNKLNLGHVPNRAEIQAMFGFAYFDECCWNCASPLHHRPACKNDDVQIKKLAQELHQINHPLSAEAAARKQYYRSRARI